MPYIHFFAVYMILLLLVSYFCIRKDKPVLPAAGIVFLFGAAILIRLILAVSSKFAGSSISDVQYFAFWADRVASGGFKNFYSPEAFTDYPPGYMYVLWIIGKLKALLSLQHLSKIHVLLVKSPAMICDIAAGYLLYREGRRKMHENQIFFLVAAYLFNPVVLLNSCVWGQVDAVLVLPVVLMCYYLTQGRMLPSYIVYGIGVMMKPQMVVFTPILIVGILDHVILKDFSVKKFLINLGEGLCVIACMLLAAMPFGLKTVIEQFKSTLASYPYATTNGYNFWALVNMNWVSQDTRFIILTAQTWGSIVIVLIVLFSLYIGLKLREDKYKYYMLGAFIISTMFTFSARMHERYIFPALMLLLFAYVYKPSRRILGCFGLLSLCHFYNVAHVFFHYDPHNFVRRPPVVLLTSLFTVLAVLLLYYVIHMCYTGKKSAELIFAHSDAELRRLTAGEEEAPAIENIDNEGAAASGEKSAVNAADTPEARSAAAKEAHEALVAKRNANPKFAPRRSEKLSRMTRLDLILLLGIMVVYTVFAMRDLGEHKAPETYLDVANNQYVEFKFADNVIPKSVSYYIAPYHGRTFTLEGRTSEDADWVGYGEVEFKVVWTWQTVQLASNESDIRLILTSDKSRILELVFKDADGNIIVPENSYSYPMLYDENYLYPERPSFRNGMMFDEIYHARTAYEYINGMYSYENTHPPLGKIFIAIGVMIFGMNPFGWRIMGVLFGIAMLPFIYIFGKRITRNTPASFLTCMIFAFDFMHFTQTRIATIDVFITFFVILMYLFMYEYSRLSFYDTPLKKTFIPLGASGVCMGLGLASKWTGVYAGAGLAIIFFAVLYRRYREYLFAKQEPGGVTDGIKHVSVIRKFPEYAKKTVIFCVGFFGVIPALIYTASYIPFRDNVRNTLLSRMFHNQATMFNYHSSLEAGHSFASPFYQWPTMVRPVWYYSGNLGDNVREGISAFGNPLVWWVGIPAFIFMLYLWFTKKDRIAAFLSISYLAQYVPWFFVSRATFMYHYFPCVPFVVLMIGYALMQFKSKMKPQVFWAVVIAYSVLVFLLFLLFYPVLAGQPVTLEFVAKWLRWFDSWVLVA